MDMSKFLVDAYFTEHEHKAKYMMGSSDPESLEIKDAVQDFSRYADVALGYELGNGYLPLRQKLADLYENIDAEQLAVMNGGEEAIYVTMRALLEPGDEVVVHMPSYQSLSVIAKENRCRIIEYRPAFENSWEFDIKLLESKITDNTKMLVLNYPHNPTGACLGETDMTKIAELCRAHNLLLVSDEVYRFLSVDENCVTSSFADLYDKTVAIGSFSKTFAAPGLRLGWIATGNQEIMEKLLLYRHFASTCTNLPCQLIADELLNRKNEIIRRNNSIVRANAKLLEQFLKKHQDFFSYVMPKGATMAYIKLKNGQSAMKFCMELLEHTGVLIVPSSVLENSDEYLRIGLGRRSFPDCIRLVDDYLTECKNKKEG